MNFRKCLSKCVFQIRASGTLCWSHSSITVFSHKHPEAPAITGQAGSKQSVTEEALHHSQISKSPFYRLSTESQKSLKYRQLKLYYTLNWECLRWCQGGHFLALHTLMSPLPSIRWESQHAPAPSPWIGAFPWPSYTWSTGLHIITDVCVHPCNEAIQAFYQGRPSTNLLNKGIRVIARKEASFRHFYSSSLQKWIHAPFSFHPRSFLQSLPLKYLKQHQLLTSTKVTMSSLQGFCVSQPSLIPSWTNTEGAVLRVWYSEPTSYGTQGLENARIITPMSSNVHPKLTAVACSVYNPVYILGCKIAAGTKECLWIQDDFISNLFSTINKWFRKKWRKLNPSGDILNFAPVGS